MRVPERRHLRVQIRHLPERPPLALKSERRERSIVGAAFRKARAEQTGMGEQVRGHESAVAVAADAHPIAVADSHLHYLVDRRLRARYELLDVVIVGCFTRAD